MAPRKKIIAGNWKMHKTSSEARSLIKEIVSGISVMSTICEVIVAPPFTAISAAVEETQNTPIFVAAQNMHWEDKGAYTGEISGAMLKEAGCSHVIIGHSERRQYFGETDQTVNWKLKAAIRGGLVPIFCLGETIEQREEGNTFAVVESQLKQGLDGISISDPERLVIAYEPVWAIGTGHTATPQQAQEVHAFLRDKIISWFGFEIGNSIRILYGGSVKPENAGSLMACADIDGGLIGGASLKANDFLEIIEKSA
mgnify:CR=1 FL=1